MSEPPILPPDEPARRLTEWRAAVARYYLTGISVVMPVLLLVWAALRPSPRFDGAFFFIGGASLTFILARAFAPSRVQAGLIVGLMSGVAFVGPAVLGLSPGPFLAALSGVIIGGVTFGRRLALGLLAATTAVFLGYGLAFGQRWLDAPSLATQAALASNWVRLAMFFLLSAGLLLLVLTDLFQRMEDAWRATAEAAERQRHEQEQRQRAEERAMSAQRLEAIGRLAGGVAHDFNNLLVVLMSWAEMLRTAKSDEQRREGLDAIRDATAQAAQLTRQLLSFARKDVAQPGPLDVERAIAATRSSLRRLLPEDVRIEHSPSSAPPVLADAGQLGQVLLNLATNAGDAMPQGGVLTLRTELVEPPRVPPEAPDPSGRYVAIHVTDTGVGMDEATKASVFEPFFTTKERGRGTGLGLASVYGIATQARGYVSVVSAPGQGATFTVAFPVAPPGLELQPVPVITPRTSALLASSRVLLVEDDAAVRATMSRVLGEAGFQVVEAPNVDAALAVLGKEGLFDVLCTDAVMPGLPTQTLVEAFAKRFPAAPVLVCSGHLEEELLRRGIEEGAVALMSKPFAPEALVARLEELLATKSRRGRGA